MTRRIPIVLIICVMLGLAACAESPAETPAPISEPTAQLTDEVVETPEVDAVAPQVYISEVLGGIKGNNNFEFIELYNVGSAAPYDLRGISLWYKLADGEEEQLVFEWNDHALIPPQRHYLLGRSGEDYKVEVDAVIELPLVPQRGGLQLRAVDGTVLDSLAWGSGDSEFTEGAPAVGMSNGVSIERAPAGVAGNGTDTNNNEADFAQKQYPNPQNTGSPAAPKTDTVLKISLEAPEDVEPGEEFSYSISVFNQTGKAVSDLVVQLPIPKVFEILEVADGMQVSEKATFWDLATIGENNHVVLWSLTSLAADETKTASIQVKAPWTYLSAEVSNYSVQASDWPQAGFGGTVRTEFAGGAIPIGIARSFVNEEIIVEGIATMYTGGYYAGSGNTKFYMEDETGGIQVWVDDGEGEVEVSLGDRVRVRGILLAYRGAMELAPPVDGVEVIEKGIDTSLWAATLASVEEVDNDNLNLPGKLVQAEGTVARVEEFSYSYEIDLVDDAGHLASIYVDKLTNISVEAIESGEKYRISGVIEVLDSSQRMYPRIQGDLVKVYPPGLYLDLAAPNNVSAGENFSVSLTVTNHTTDVLSDVVITAPLPLYDFTVEYITDGGVKENDAIIWTISELAGDGGSVLVSFEANSITADASLRLDQAQAVAADWPETGSSQTHYIFLGETVPVWAIQGEGSRSPYIFNTATSTGVVTGVFPELEGFWIQALDDDDNPQTSEGLYIYTGEMEIPVLPGDWVQVTGAVRESYQQTQLQVAAPEDILVLSSGHSLPLPVELDPPASMAESEIYNEALEGMFVQVTGPALAVAPTNRYGEYALVRSEHEVERLWQGGENGIAILVDDGSAASHDDSSMLEYTINTGDQVSGLAGPLAYTFGSYKIEPVTVQKVIPAGSELPSLSPLASDEFSLMSWNVENLFDFQSPNPSSPPMPTIDEYKLYIEKVANTIVASGLPTVIGLQEVENIGVLEDIAEHEALAGYGYQPVLIEGTDSRGIDVGYLVRSDQATVLSEYQYVAPEGLTSRPPLLVEVEVTTAAGSATVFVLNNHFTSMSGGEAATEPRRNAQAAWNVTVMEEILAENPGAYLSVMGDLNSYYDALPIDTLREAGLAHVFEVLPASERYTYIYQGASQVLDHILVTPDLMNLLRRVDVLHVNADFAPALPGDGSPQRKSDHDPVIAVFSLTP
ncbi:MAG: lamin tail domain-containing protein [Anaerolineales bacterium]|nr:lamin tail domain-containing protein [Chloroflexota bacterium]MBL6979722.1 lamin tail domain-containing protein [Anaerolineales bacterium]